MLSPNLTGVRSVPYLPKSFPQYLHVHTTVLTYFDPRASKSIVRRPKTSTQSLVQALTLLERIKYIFNVKTQNACLVPTGERRLRVLLFARQAGRTRYTEVKVGLWELRRRPGAPRSPDNPPASLSHNRY